MMDRSGEVLSFWIDEVGPKGWYRQDEALDETIRERFGEMWEEARAGRLGTWTTAPNTVLAFLILTDQFPRNMFRGDSRAFATDAMALATAKAAISKGWDMRTPEPQRQFFYLPMMHSESLCDQEHCIRLLIERLPETGGDNLLHARAHREVIRRFGRFPYRNAALQRADRECETAYVAEGGYGATVRELQKAG